MVTRARRWPGLFADSIALMQAAAAARALPGVAETAAVLATPANLQALAEARLDAPELSGARPTDLVASVRAVDAATAERALDALYARLDRRQSDAAGSSATAEPAPRSLTLAVRRVPEATLALISVPGTWAAAEAAEALSAGLDVVLFSDGVTLADEVVLKRRARALGRLVMGPECGTAIVGGLGLGFANRVRRGGIGLVGASGTGLQEVACLVDRLGAGISHALGTGGRDLDDAVGGLATIDALGLLADDDATRVIALVSKPGSPRVAADVLAAAAAAGKPVIACLLGWTGAPPPGLAVVPTLETVATGAVALLSRGLPQRLPCPRTTVRPSARRPRGPGAGGIRGLFTGGTLCAEAERLVGPGPHRFVDFGAGEFTRGAPHPMIAPERRARAIAECGDDPEVGVVLFDVVLGDGAHPDPAGVAAAALGDARARAAAAGRELAAVAHVVGTAADPQGLARQEAELRKAGAVVAASNCLAAELARELAGRAP